MTNKVIKLGMAMFLMGTLAVFAGEKSTTFKVYGNCSMCESTIEKAANSVEGVNKADWNKESKMMEVSFDDTKTDEQNVHKAIANAGYDTEKQKASDEAYNELPGCCQYDRKEEKASCH